MTTRSPHTGLILATLLLVAVMFLLPRWSFAHYSLLEYTTSHLGAQESPNAWVMNVTYILVGVAVLLAGWHKLAHAPLALLALGVFAVSLVLCGFYRHEPVVEALDANDFEARRHSLFATTMAVGFVAFALAMVFISEMRRDRVLAAMAGALATLLSLAMVAWPDLMGLFQRTMFLIAFGWLVYVTRDGYRLIEAT